MKDVNLAVALDALFQMAGYNRKLGAWSAEPQIGKEAEPLFQLIPAMSEAVSLVLDKDA